jgi:CRP-like cAMP-binding protein
MEIKQALRGTISILGLSEADLAKLTPLAKEVGFEGGDLILLSGERSKAFYVLMSGSAAVEVTGDFYSVCIQALAPGDAFGWSSLLDDQTTLFQVRAREQCSALLLNGPAVTALCHEDPALGVKLLELTLRTVVGRVRGLELRLAEFGGFQRNG